MADKDPTYLEVVKAKYNGSSVNHARHPNRLSDQERLEDHQRGGRIGSLFLSRMAPASLCHPRHAPFVLDRLHIPHAGQVKTRKALPTKAPAAPLDPPTPRLHAMSEPIQAVGMDLFATGGANYILMVHRHSGYKYVHHLTTTTTLDATGAVKKWFKYFGLPKSICSDGGAVVLR